MFQSVCVFVCLLLSSLALPPPLFPRLRDSVFEKNIVLNNTKITRQTRHCYFHKSQFLHTGNSAFLVSMSIETDDNLSGMFL